ncbi:MAG TPA: EamA family transporter [Pseudonocardiaceae bacterium]|nr:EamA family transporter [Pseudonocardiaceae bacterium]
MSALLLSLVAALGYGVSDFVGGLAARRVAVLRVVVASYPVGMVGMALVAPFAGGTLTTPAIVFGALSGIVGGGAILCYYAALAEGPMSVVSPLTAVLVAGIPLGAGLIMGEHLSAVALIGAGIAVIAVLLVSRQKDATEGEHSARFTPKVALLTVASGAAFGVFFILLDQVGPHSGMWPLLVSRTTSTVLMLVAALFAKQLRPPTGVPLRLALMAGLLDVVANAAFLYALRAGLLSLVSVLTSLYPASTVLLARLVLGERTGWTQRIGLVLAAAAIAMISGSSVSA